MIARVKVLFKGHNKLISGFNIFLPEGLEIAVDDDEVVEEAPPPKKADQALALVNNIKVQQKKKIYLFKCLFHLVSHLYLPVLQRRYNNKDMLLESAGSAAKMGEELLTLIIEKKISLEEGSFRVEDHFTGL